MCLNFFSGVKQAAMPTKSTAMGRLLPVAMTEKATNHLATFSSGLKRGKIAALKHPLILRT